MSRLFAMLIAAFFAVTVLPAAAQAPTPGEQKMDKMDKKADKEAKRAERKAKREKRKAERKAKREAKKAEKAETK